MQTQVIPGSNTAVPWLEYYPGEGTDVRQAPLAPLPFLMGRDATATLQLPSSRVSRQHAVILGEGSALRIKDLGSTNGTFVNGRRVETAILSDGDILTLADVEVSFFSGRAASLEHTVTQVIAPSQAEHTEEDVALGIIRGVRHLHEMLVHGCFESLFEPVVELGGTATSAWPPAPRAHGDVGMAPAIFGYEVVDPATQGPSQSAAERLLLGTDCRLTARLRQLRRMTAIEAARGLRRPASVLVHVDACELGDAALAGSLSRLRERLAERHRLVVVVPENTVSDATNVRGSVDRLRDLGVGVAFDGFRAGAKQLRQHEGLRPDYVRLSSALVRTVHRRPESQSQIQEIAAVAKGIGCQLVAAGLRQEEEAEVLGAAGCRFGQGPLFGGPQPIEHWTCPPRCGTSSTAGGSRSQQRVGGGGEEGESKPWKDSRPVRSSAQAALPFSSSPPSPAADSKPEPTAP